MIFLPEIILFCQHNLTEGVQKVPGKVLVPAESDCLMIYSQLPVPMT